MASTTETAAPSFPNHKKSTHLDHSYLKYTLECRFRDFCFQTHNYIRIREHSNISSPNLLRIYALLRLPHIYQLHPLVRATLINLSNINEDLL